MLADFGRLVLLILLLPLILILIGPLLILAAIRGPNRRVYSGSVAVAASVGRPGLVCHLCFLSARYISYAGFRGWCT